MYNKLFTKILHSSIWMQNTPTRIVWVTFLAAMDEDGFCDFASIKNVAHTARVTEEEAAEAIRILESPDPDSSDPDNDGRRIERVPGGWMVLNAPKYREMATREHSKAKTRERVRRFRNAHVTPGNGAVTNSGKCNDSVTPSEAYTEAEKALPNRSTDFNSQEAAMYVKEQLHIKGQNLLRDVAEGVEDISKQLSVSFERAAEVMVERWRAAESKGTDKSFFLWLRDGKHVPAKSSTDSPTVTMWRRKDGTIVGGVN